MTNNNINNNKKIKKEKEVKENKISSKTLFDHVNNLLTTNDIDYYDKLSDSDKKTWSTFMINRFISMNPDYIEVINNIQAYSDIPPELISKLYIEILPRKKIYLKYIKNTKIEKYGNEVIQCIMNYYLCSKKEALEYIDILSKDEVYNIVRKFGITEIKEK